MKIIDLYQISNAYTVLSKKTVTNIQAAITIASYHKPLRDALDSVDTIRRGIIARFPAENKRSVDDQQNLIKDINEFMNGDIEVILPSTKVKRESLGDISLGVIPFVYLSGVLIEGERVAPYSEKTAHLIPLFMKEIPITSRLFNVGMQIFLAGSIDNIGPWLSEEDLKVLPNVSPTELVELLPLVVTEEPNKGDDT